MTRYLTFQSLTHPKIGLQKNFESLFAIAHENSCVKTKTKNQTTS